MGGRGAFTLVELVIVVLILGILAAVAAPRLLDTSAEAQDASVRQSLSVIRDAIDKYRAINGEWPAQDSAGSTFKAQITPYLAGPIPPGPVGPAKGDNRVRVVTKSGPIGGGTTPNRAWKFNSETGEFIYNYDGVSSDGVTLYEEF